MHLKLIDSWTKQTFFVLLDKMMGRIESSGGKRWPAGHTLLTPGLDSQVLEIPRALPIKEIVIYLFIKEEEKFGH